MLVAAGLGNGNFELRALYRIEFESKPTWHICRVIHCLIIKTGTPKIYKLDLCTRAPAEMLDKSQRRSMYDMHKGDLKVIYVSIVQRTMKRMTERNA